MNKNKYLFGLIGLLIGFAVSFFWTQNYNKTHSNAATGAGTTSGAARGGAADQKAMMGDVSAAIQKAKDNPKDFDAQVAAAQMYIQIGRSAEAVEYLKKAVEADAKHPQAFVIAASIANYYLSIEKNDAESDKWLNRALEIGSDDPEGYVEVADMLIQRQPPNPDKAIQLLDRALKQSPKNGHALGHLVEAHLLKKDARAAEETLNRLKGAEPNNKRISIYENLLADVQAGKAITIPKE